MDRSRWGPWQIGSDQPMTSAAGSAARDDQQADAEHVGRRVDVEGLPPQGVGCELPWHMSAYLPGQYGASPVQKALWLVSPKGHRTVRGTRKNLALLSN